jgi:hypothetical protein
LGNVIRRCRIDFGTEIDLDISPLLRVRDGSDHNRHKSRHFIVGTITYSVPHAESLGWTDLDAKSRTGVIILFKPAVLNDESADVRQYKLENSNFPQQTTADQWYDETQFESYRKLGQLCAESAFRLREVKQHRQDMLDHGISKLRLGGDFDQRVVEKIFRGLEARESESQQKA